MRKDKASEYFKQIKQAAIDGKLIFFVGAGVSALSDYPSWKGLVHEFEKGILGKNTELREYASDEYLRIPQKYYVHRGKNKYNGVLESFFNVDYECNEIHEMMVELNPKHFITTNYDRLIEKACIKKHMNYSGISCDRDVARATSNHYILKVHGEFKDSIDGKDIVLKENDYINYDENYPLINNLVKSLVATNTVVFIGYGLNDYNINQMLNWVKRIQKNDFSHYFVRVDYKPLRAADIKYYKKRGMNIIDVTSLKKTDEHDYFSRYKYFLNKLMDEGKWDQVKDVKSSLTFISNKLQGLDSFNFIRKSDFRLVFDGDYTLYPSGKLFKSNSCKYDYFKDYIDYKDKKNERDEELDQLIDQIDMRLARLNLLPIYNWEIEDKKIREDSIEIPFFSHQNLLIENRYEEIKVVLEKEMDSLHKKYIQAFYRAGLGEWKKAYLLFNEIVNESFIELDWLLYFFALLNRYFLSRLIIGINRQLRSGYARLIWGRTYVVFNDGFIGEVEKTATFMKPSRIYSSMPLQFQEEYSFLKWLCDDVSFGSESIELSKLQISCSKKVKTNSINFGKDNDYDKLYTRINDNVRFCYENFLWVYPSSEFKGMIEIALNPLFENIRKGQSTNNKVSFFGNLIQVDREEYYIDYYDFIYIVKGYTLKNLKGIFEDIRIHDVRFEGVERIEDYILRTLKNFEMYCSCDEGIDVIKYIMLSEEIKNVLFISSKLKVKESTLIYLLKFITSINFDLILDIGDICNYTTNLLRNNVFCEEGIEIIDDFLWDRFERRIDEKYEEYSSRSNIYQFLTATLRDQSEEYFHERISEAITCNSGGLTKKQFTYGFTILSVLKAEAQELVVKEIKDYSLESIIYLLDLDILHMLPNYKESVIEAIEVTAKKIEENRKAKIATYPVPSLRYAGILYIVGYLQDVDLKNYYGVCDEFDMLVSPEKFDFENKFDLNWIKSYTSKVLEAIFENELLRNTISKILKKSILDSYDEALVKILIKYCCI